MRSFMNLFKWTNTKSTRQVIRVTEPREIKIDFHASKGDLLEDDFSMDLPDDLLTEWQAYCLGARKINGTDALAQAIALLQKINQQNNSKYYSLKLQKTIIDAIDHYKETTIIMPYQSIICALEKEAFMFRGELCSLEELCHEGLINCKNFLQFKVVLSDKIEAFSKENQKELKSIFITTDHFSDEGCDNFPPKYGFYFCINKIKEKKTEKDIEKICDDVSILCEHVQQNELEDTFNYQSLRSSRDRIKSETEKLKRLSLNLPKNPDIDRFIKNMDKTNRKIENEMSVARLFANHHLELIKDKITLDAIRDALVEKPSYLQLIKHGENDASPKKKLVYPRFIDKFKNAQTLDELYTLIVEGHLSKSKDQEIITLNSKMIRNTKCGMCGLFGLFYKSTTHRYLNKVAKDFQNIVDEYFENKSPLNKKLRGGF